MLIKLHEREIIFTRSTTPWPNIFVKRILTHDLFATANRLVCLLFSQYILGKHLYQRRHRVKLIVCWVNNTKKTLTYIRAYSQSNIMPTCRPIKQMRCNRTALSYTWALARIRIIYRPISIERASSQLRCQIGAL